MLLLLGDACLALNSAPHALLGHPARLAPLDITFSQVSANHAQLQIAIAVRPVLFRISVPFAGMAFI